MSDTKQAPHWMDCNCKCHGFDDNTGETCPHCKPDMYPNYSTDDTVKQSDTKRGWEGKSKEEIFRWGYRLLLALAVRNLHDAQNKGGNWPGEMEWGQLVGSSQAIFLSKARDEAGVDDWYIEAVRNGDVDVDDIWKEFEGKDI